MSAKTNEPPARGYADLHDHLRRLEEAGLLYRIDAAVNKDTEMHPLVRWQFRGGIPEKDRKAFLFTNVVDSKGNGCAARVNLQFLVDAANVTRTVWMLKPI